MVLLCKINFVLITVLAIAAGIPKLAGLQNEVDFFNQLGLGSTPLLVFGVLQIAGGLFLALRGTRVVGAVLAAVMFAASAGMLVATGRLDQEPMNPAPRCLPRN